MSSILYRVWYLILFAYFLINDVSCNPSSKSRNIARSFINTYEYLIISNKILDTEWIETIGVTILSNLRRLCRKVLKYFREWHRDRHVALLFWSAFFCATVIARKRNWRTAQNGTLISSLFFCVCTIYTAAQLINCYVRWFAQVSI